MYFLVVLFSFVLVTCDPRIEQNNEYTEGEDEYSQEIAMLTANNKETFLTNPIKAAIKTTKQYSDLVLHGGDNGTRGPGGMSWGEWVFSCFGLFGSKKKSASQSPSTQSYGASGSTSSQSYGCSSQGGARSTSQPQTVAKASVVLTVNNKTDFVSKVINSQKPVLVMFTDYMCGTCKTLGPQLENLVAGKDGKILYAKVDVDQVKHETTNGINGFPTVKVFKNGSPTGDTLYPVKPLNEYHALVDKNIN